MFRLKSDLERFESMRSVFLFGQNLHVTLEEDEAAGNLGEWLRELGHRQVQIEAIEPGVEDCFMELMSIGPGEET